MFVGAVSDNFDERIEQKIFHSEIVVDNEKVSQEMKAYQKIPQITSFLDTKGNNTLEETIQANYRQVKLDIESIIELELKRIENDPELAHLINKKK